MAIIITEADVPQEVKDRLEAGTLTLMVDGLNAKATRVAPCLADGNPEVLA